MPEPTDTELLTELGPLAAAIADKISTIPVRHCPGGTDDLITELTLAVAVYVGRHVLPTEAAELRQPPRPTTRAWVIESQWRDGQWRSYGAGYDDRAEAREDYDDIVTRRGHQHAYRLVRATTVYAVEAEHQPAAVSQPGKARQADTAGEQQ